MHKPKRRRTHTNADAHTVTRARAHGSRKRTVFWFGPFFFLLIFTLFIQTAATAAAAEYTVCACCAHAPPRTRSLSWLSICARGVNRFQRSGSDVVLPRLRAGSKIVCARARLFSLELLCVSVFVCVYARVYCIICVFVRAVCDNDRPTDTLCSIRVRRARCVRSRCPSPPSSEFDRVFS